MKNSASGTREQRIPANPARVWEIIADPSMQERVDRRCRVESATGDWRSEGSEFVLFARGVRMRYGAVRLTVREAQ